MEVDFVNFYLYEKNSELNILKFDKMNDDWLDFIASGSESFAFI